METIDAKAGKVGKQKRFDKRDFKLIADIVCDEFDTRKKKRQESREKEWLEIDRQIRMEPDTKFKQLPDGRVDKKRAWMAEMELPNQAQTLEVLTADARRMMFPDSGSWFAPHALMSDDYLERVDMTSLIAGDNNEIPSRIDQDNADKIVEAFIHHLHSQYDFEGNIDLVNAEAFKYGVGVARVRMARKSVYMRTARGVEKVSNRIPVVFPRSIKNTYLDDRKYTVMNEGLVLGPAVISCKTQRYEDLVLAANKGSNDPLDEDGGWMPANLKGLEDNGKGEIELLEYEGDMIVPRQTVKSLFLPGVIATVVKGRSGGKSEARTIRLRFKETPMPSHIEFPYHKEDIDCAYASSPLMKGRVVQASATNSLNRLLDSAALNIEPPVRYSRDDSYFAQNGGPMIFPGAQWSTLDPVTVMQIGDPSTMFALFSGFMRQYADLTGTDAPRLGAQTVSHTTAFAKEAELSRGTVRTVDYVRSCLKGPMNQILNMEYQLGRKNLKGDIDAYSVSYGGWLRLNKKVLPDHVEFEAHGSGGPAEAQQKMQSRLNALQLAIQMDQLNMQTGQPPKVDIGAAIEQVLREGGWVDTSAITRVEDVAQGNPGPSAVPGASEPVPGAAVAALQALGQ